MATEYDRKFAEMKQYIPFLECMIKRLENTNLSSEQPRRAQLEKIRSLRDLLLVKRKRGVTNDLNKVTKIKRRVKKMMKMENLLKCEQVLVNLYAKMDQQTDFIPKICSQKPKEKEEFDVVRNKLKSVVSKSLAEEDNQSDTFEIASRSETEELCTSSGSKEPALFQRRANKASSPPEINSSPKPVPKRNYTRVLVSPEPSSSHWTDDTHSGKPLFRRRSPRQSPKKSSPTYHKKERRKSFSGRKKTSKDLNITLNVPEESLSSLNSEDLLSRIINCNDNDVDIDTLRDVRKQILGELQQTGAGDITEAIMKSYKKKSKSKKSKSDKKTEVEEGELSDSESEAIKSIYGSLVLVDKDKNTSGDVKGDEKPSNEKGKKPRKIQICLVINKHKEDHEPRPTTNDISEFELFDIDTNKEINVDKTFKDTDKKTDKNECVSAKSEYVTTFKQNKDQDQDQQTETNTEKIPINSAEHCQKQSVSSVISLNTNSRSDIDLNTKNIEETSKNTVPFKPNFYKSTNEQDTESVVTPTETKKSETQLKEEANEKESDDNSTHVKTFTDNKDCEKSKKDDGNGNYQINNEIQIPLLNEDPPVPPPPKEHVVSEIDILQALKNDILSENIGITAGETTTPLLHQPKVTKVASVQEIGKKRISIEKYKEIVSVSKKSLFLREPSTSSPKDDNTKKQSLKLTEKECERFNFPPKLALDDSSDEEKDTVVLDDIYGNLVPKSPERDDISNVEYSAPVIIPVEPVEPIVVNSSKDIDMRKFPLSPPTIDLLSSPTVELLSQSPTINLVSPSKCNEATKSESVYRPPQIDPRFKWELNMSSHGRSPNSRTINFDINSRTKNHPNMTPSMTPSRTPSMTTNVRTYEMTPSRQSFEFDDNSSQKHVYAPILPIYEPMDQRETSISRENQRPPHWEPNSDLSPEGRRSRWDSSERRDGPNSREWGDHSNHREKSKEFHNSRHDSRRNRYGYDKRDDYLYNRSECPRTPVHSFGRSDCPSTPNPSFGRLETPLTSVHPFGRSDCPNTPSHPFGRSDCPMTPGHPFGRSELPMTPSHPFGRSEAPMTSLHSSFGRSDAPMTPSHPFGRPDAPMTPSHPFGRSDAPMTSSHSFGGKSDYSHNSGKKFHKDPRLNRSSNFESTSRNYDTDRERGQFDDKRNTFDPSHNFRERSVGRSDRTYERNSQSYSKEQMSHREPSVSRSLTRDYESNNLYAGDRRDSRIATRYENEGINHNEVDVRREFQRARSVGRGTPSTDRYLSSSRGPSNYIDNTLSVEPQSGHSFTIDTSVNRTFLEFLNQKGITPFAPSFDKRMQRASSVGRALLPDPNSFNARRQRSSSVGRALLPDLDLHSFDARRQRSSSVGRSLIPVESIGRNMRESSVGRTLSRSIHISRAQSIGRDTSNYRNERTLNEIKADFQSYSASLKKFVHNKPEKQIKYVDPRTRKVRKQALEQKWVKQPSNIAKPYSPRKNPRDPRFRRELQNESRHKNIDEKDRERRKHGIVYSNDNIAKGTILGSGYGVKNYKIPKIKRPIEKVELTENEITSEKKESEKIKASVGKKDENAIRVTKDAKKQPKKLTNIKEKDKTSDKEKKSQNTENNSSDGNRNTKADSDKSKFLGHQAAFKSRKSKRAVIRDSDSDDGNSIKEKRNNDQKSLSEEKAKAETDKTPRSSDVKSNNNQDSLLDTSFGMEDLEIPDNINALIADLDSDLGDDKIDKSSKFTKELSIENLFDSIDSPENNEMTVEESLKDLSDLINADMDIPEVKKPPHIITSENKNLNKTHDGSDIVKEIEKELKQQSSDILKEKLNSNKNSKIYVQEIIQPNEDETNKSCETQILQSNQLEIESNVDDKMNKSLDETQILLNIQPEIECSKGNKTNKSLTVHELQTLQIECNSFTSIKEGFAGKTNELQDKVILKAIPISEDTKQSTDDNKTENIVSTSDIGEEALDVNEQETYEQVAELSTPDSTISSNETSTIKDHLPDSTNVINNEMHSDVTSSHETADTSNRLEPPFKEAPTELSSVENFLILLQDKSKIKQLLSMLGGDKTSENEKLKKKLEKLSEIVSDDEVSNDATVTKVTVPSDVQDGLVETEPNAIHKNINESFITDSVTTDSKEPNVIVSKEQHERKKNLSEDSQTLEKEFSNVASVKTRKNPVKKIKRRKKKFTKSEKVKRITRSGAAALQSSKAKPKENRELKKLQEDIKEMFIKDDVLNATGIRMCRLAKFVEEKNPNEEEDVEPQPVVVLEKFKTDEALNKKLAEIKSRKKIPPKPKTSINISSEAKNKGDLKISPKFRAGPKSKTKPVSRTNADPYDFEADSDSNTKNSDDGFQSSDSEQESLASSASFGSSEVLAELRKKPRRKRGRAWQSGVIKPRKKKIKTKSIESSLNENTDLMEQRKNIILPDMNSFTDKSYCFRKSFTVYPCRLCEYSGDDIVHHYKTRHPHSEIPLSRMNPETARDAIKESEEINFQAISRIPTEKYVCRFCFKELISKRKDTLLETFFWHVVSTHTGEYKQLCSECINVTRCPFSLDIPPPPKDVNGQLIGYICEKCNFTQLSLENLKTHVIVRHNDEQTSVYMVNLAFMSKKAIKNAMEQIDQRVLRSSRSNQSVTEQSDIDGRSDITERTDYLSETDTQKTKSVSDSPALESVSKVKKLRSKLTFENEDNASDISNVVNADNSIKMESSDDFDHEHDADESASHNEPEELDRDKNQKKQTLFDKEIKSRGATDDIVDLPHFKVSFNDNGAKEYVCCINGLNHYYTPLLISMKKHVQMKHKENWDGYCSICKVIVMPQGAHTFKDCFQHLLDNHFDNFPVIHRNKFADSAESVSAEPVLLLKDSTETVKAADKPSSPKSFINVRPLSDLVSKDINPESEESPVLPVSRDINPESEESPVLPVIESVISLGIATVDPPQASSPIPTTDEPTPVRLPTPQPRQPTPSRPPSVPLLTTTPQKQIDYEKAQADVIAKKQKVVLDTMMSRDTLVHIFKCAGRYCCFSTDSAENALLHASAHQRMGGENSLICAYCDFDCSGNTIDLVTHVFKVHGRCQFACDRCFYRAVSSQLVSAHMTRAHEKTASKGVVLKTSIVTPGEDAPSELLLSREVAVAYYICVNAPSTCKYRTYIEHKFGEHLAKHEPPFLCNVCSVGFPVVTALLEHLKCHDMKLYQCTWCVHGADDEADLLAHTAASHPLKVPQAYLRVVTTREAPDGTLKMMVLPLAQINNSEVSTELVTPCSKQNNPVREAERAFELEKLMNVFSTATVQESVNDADGIIEDSIQADKVEQLLSQSPRTTTPPPSICDDLSMQTTPVLKTEPIDNASEVINLDSDDEDARLPVIDVSDEDIARSDDQGLGQKEVPVDLLYKCSIPSCSYVCKRVHLFRKHLEFSCFKEGVPMKCAHCPIAMNSIQAVIQHYDEKHGVNSPKINVCGTCGLKDPSLANLKRHFRSEHSSKDLVVSSNRREDGTFVYTVRETQKTTPLKGKPGPVSQRQKPGPKRKLSSGNLTESPAKKKRYGPQDVDLLPAKPILDELVYCGLCEFNTKVRLNLVRHLQLHAEKQPVAQTVPVNPVPHLETNEKHFDKMVNLASSSIVTRAPDKPTRTDPGPSVSLMIPPEAASRYPKYVPDRQRLTCGAKGCSYTSVDERMLKRHWETLHAGTNDYHCVHCPPYQHLDTSIPLTASRVIAHLKMHDIHLYACSSCTYYHSKRQVLEKHLNEVHQGLGQVMVVREEGSPTTSTGINQLPPTSGPTMDLKPWQCGLCKFKSMLRQEVVEHCAKFHNSKMQFKCPNCPFRTSTIENVTKHQSKSHPGSTEEVIYFYYREGSIPDDADGTPRWLKQRQRTGTVDPEVKEEVPDKSIPETPMPPVLQSLGPSAVDLNIVKKEFPDNTEASIEDLCKKYGQFCEPNGLKYKCPLCKSVDEDFKESIQSHLFEELQYRKWGCSMCTYKAFHKTGLNEHMLTEHRQNRDPIELPLDPNVEKWVAQLLKHQTDIIEKTKENFAKQKIQVAKARITPSTSKIQNKPVGTINRTKEELEQAFGPLGAAQDNNYCCPKCPFKTKDHLKMQDHLESELNKIRWRCSKCGGNFQEYHEAQLHCRTAHSGAAARPVEALRDPTVRAAWVTTVLHLQRQTLSVQATESPSKSAPKPVTFIPAADPLLEVRYEKNVPTPEEEMLARRKRPAPSPSKPDSDDERLVIDEHGDDDDDDDDDVEDMQPKKKINTKKCPHCNFNTRYTSSFNFHILRHYNLKPYTCGYCDFKCHSNQCKAHNEMCHPHLRNSFFMTRLPTGPPTNVNLEKKGKRIPSTDSDQLKPKEAKEDAKPKDDTPKVHVICLVCEKSVLDSDCWSHIHDNHPAHFGKRGEVVVKCCNCWILLPNVESLNEHHNTKHYNAKLNYAYYRLGYDTREIHACDHCDKRFKFLRDLKSHHNAVHGACLQLKYTMKPYTTGDVQTIDLEDDKNMRVEPAAIKRIAKKSTTKLPAQNIAKKSTSKLPFFYVEADSESEEEYSYYGGRPQPLAEYTNLSCTPFRNELTTFSMKQLSEIIKIDPLVVVKDINKK